MGTLAMLTANCAASRSQHAPQTLLTILTITWFLSKLLYLNISHRPCERICLGVVFPLVATAFLQILPRFFHLQPSASSPYWLGCMGKSFLLACQNCCAVMENTYNIWSHLPSVCCSRAASRFQLTVTFLQDAVDNSQPHSGTELVRNSCLGDSITASQV